MCKMMIVTFKQENFVGNAYIDYDAQKGNLLSNIKSYFVTSDKIRSDCNLEQVKENEWSVELNNNDGEVMHSNFLNAEELIEMISNIEILNTTVEKYFYTDDVLIPNLEQLLENIKGTDGCKSAKFLVNSEGYGYKIRVLYTGIDIPNEDRIPTFYNLLMENFRKEDVHRIYFVEDFFSEIDKSCIE